jgi:hypothetical protein
MIVPSSTSTMVLVRSGAVLSLAVVGAFLATGALAGCGSDAPTLGPDPSTSQAGVPTAPTQARAQLAARAAAAEDRRLLALYTLATPGRPDRTVAVVRADDGSWRVDIPGGALGGFADVSVAQNKDGLFQCELPSIERLAAASCVRVADPGGAIASAYDPRVQHPFTDWLEVLTDRQAALAVSSSAPLPGLSDGCFAVESTSASLAAPLDVGIYCYAPDGTLTGAKLRFGTLTLTGTPSAAPPSVALPGPVVDGEPLPMAAPPPSPSATPTSGG